MFLSITPNGADELTIVSETTSTGIVLLQGAIFGAPTWQHIFSGSRGTQGARAAQGRVANREVFLPLRVSGSTKDTLSGTLADLDAAVDQMRRFGGRCRVRSKNQTYAQNFEVLTATISEPVWDNRFEHSNLAAVGITLICAPYAEGDAMDVTDGFDDDSIDDDDYTADAGALSNVAVSGGQLTAVANLSTENRLIHTQRGYLMGDCEAQVKATPGSTLTSFKAGVIVKRINAQNYLEAYVADDGATSTLKLREVVAGTPNELATANLTRIVAGTPFWVRGRITAGRAQATYYTSDPDSLDPDSTGTSAHDELVASALDDSEVGQAGITWTPQHASAVLDDFRVRPFVGPRELTSKVAVMRHSGTVPGSAPALAGVELGLPGDSTAYPFGLFGWWRAPAAHNLLAEGGFESASGTSGWTNSAVTNFMGAATSVTRTTAAVTPKYGSAVGVVVCPATANTGAKAPIYGEFRAGETYTARAWVRAPSGTTNTRLRIGDPDTSSDIASTTAAALSTTWTEKTVTWTCTASTDLIYVGVEITAATATTFHLDGVQVYRGTTPPTGRHAEGQGARPPFGVFEGESYWTTTNGTIATLAGASGGVTLRDTSPDAGGDTFMASWAIDPALVSGDDYAGGSVSFVAFARVMLSAAFTGGVTALLSARPESESAATHYTSEHGSAGYALIIPSSGNDKWRLTRLGTMTLPIDRDERPRWILTCLLTLAAGTNAQDVAIDYVALVPARGHLLSPTGKADDSSYPVFAPSSASPRTVLVNPDLSAARRIGSGPFYAWGSMHGQAPEVPAGAIETLAIVSSEIPDTTTASSDSETFVTPRIHLRAAPRWGFLRESS